MTGRPTSCAAIQTPSCCTSAAVWTPGRSGSIRPDPCSGSTSINRGVIELRRKLYDETDAYRMIGSSVTDPAWLDQIPTDRPDRWSSPKGFSCISPSAKSGNCSARLAHRFGKGELLFDTLSPSGPRLSKIFTNGIVKWESATPAGSRHGTSGPDSSSKPPRWRATSRFRSRRSACVYRLMYATPMRNYDVVNRFAF